MNFERHKNQNQNFSTKRPVLRCYYPFLAWPVGLNNWRVHAQVVRNIFTPISLVILCDLFGIVKTWPFKGLLVTSNLGDKHATAWITWSVVSRHASASFSSTLWFFNWSSVLLPPLFLPRTICRCSGYRSSALRWPLWPENERHGVGGWRESWSNQRDHVCRLQFKKKTLTKCRCQNGLFMQIRVFFGFRVYFLLQIKHLQLAKYVLNKSKNSHTSYRSCRIIHKNSIAEAYGSIEKDDMEVLKMFGCIWEVTTTTRGSHVSLNHDYVRKGNHLLAKHTFWSGWRLKLIQGGPGHQEMNLDHTSSRWWFRIFFIFTPIWGNGPIWLIFFKWVETTN